MEGQLLINVPTVLEGAVLFNLNNRQDEIYLRLLELLDEHEDTEQFRDLIAFVEHWHREHRKHPYMFSNGCGCEYCTKTREYANLKLTIHRLRSKLDADWAVYPSERFKSEETYLHTLEIKLKELIVLRKDMRVHLGFISKRVLK
jgi:hypothetical protein